jgi:diadenosine tetraphosphate (Ap4A) HIT family hydrolase
VLERFPRMRGHTIIVYKPHREDISELRDDEAESVMSMCLRVIRALKSALGAEKVYVNTMCDGLPNHFHLQLFPRYAGDETASKRFVLSRSGLTQAGETASLVRAALSG